MMMPHFFYRSTFWVEIVYAIAVIISCLFIYFKTKEMYNITSYKGIKYFSQAFLFFAVAYFFRFFFRIFFSLFINLSDLMPPRSGWQVGQVGIIFYIYASTMAALYAFYSVIWKKIGEGKSDYSWALHILAVLITLLAALMFGGLFHVGLQFLLFLAAAVIGIIGKMHAGKKHHSRLYFIYTLVLLFWIFNIMAVEISGFLFEIKIILYVVSLCLFLIILWRVLKVTGYKK